MSHDPNPYAPPAVETSLERNPLDVLRQEEPAEAVFVSPATRGTITLLLMALSIVANLVMAGVIACTQVLLASMAAGYQPTQSDAANEALLHGASSVLLVGARLTAGIAFLFWTYRVVANLRALGTKYQEFSPGWAVGLYFVPILNLFRPFQALRETWNGSDPKQLGAHSDIKANVTLLGWWWGLHIFSGFAERLLRAAVGGGNDDVSSLMTTNFVIITLILLVEVPRDVLSMLVIRTLNRNQLERRELILSAAERSAKSRAPENPFAN